ncbi:MAG: hypothetical protein QOH63_2936 [Acidobacteriota bacterium]|jgi:hypothetical protein|nr:hypothetical protein [Acidobacteriota bacterium]
MSNDEDPSQVKEWLGKNNLTWPQATMTSIFTDDVPEGLSFAVLPYSLWGESRQGKLLTRRKAQD